MKGWNNFLQYRMQDCRAQWLYHSPGAFKEAFEENISSSRQHSMLIAPLIFLDVDQVHYFSCSIQNKWRLYQYPKLRWFDLLQCNGENYRNFTVRSFERQLSSVQVTIRGLLVISMSTNDTLNALFSLTLNISILPGRNNICSRCQLP